MNTGEAITLFHTVKHIMCDVRLLSVCALDRWCCSTQVVIWCLFLGGHIHPAWISPMLQGRLRLVFPREQVAALFGLMLWVYKLVTKFCGTKREVGGPGKQKKHIGPAFMTNIFPKVILQCRLVSSTMNLNMWRNVSVRFCLNKLNGRFKLWRLRGYMTVIVGLIK